MALCLSMSPVMVALETQRLERKVSGSVVEFGAMSECGEKIRRKRELFLLLTSFCGLPTISTLGTG